MEPPPPQAGGGGGEEAPSEGVDLAASVRVRPATDRPGPFVAMNGSQFATVALGEAPPGAFEAGTTSGGA